MEGRRLSYQDLEDGIAMLTLFENEEIIEDFYWKVEELPDEAVPGDQYQPEFEDGELVAIHYDEELTEQKWEDYEESLEWLDEMRDK